MENGRLRILAKTISRWNVANKNKHVRLVDHSLPAVLSHSLSLSLLSPAPCTPAARKDEKRTRKRERDRGRVEGREREELLSTQRKRKKAV